MTDLERVRAFLTVARQRVDLALAQDDPRLVHDLVRLLAMDVAASLEHAAAASHARWRDVVIAGSALEVG